MTEPDKSEIDRLLLKEKERLAELPYFARGAGEAPQYGVLLSDRIKYYCGPEFKLIDPFEEEYLRPAGYNLRVGDNYAIGGKWFTLNEGGLLTIEPYQVAVIQILETLNVPDFLIGRWNIRVGLAYKGLVWVGGAQVDPGFRGRLCCPIYNLSTEPVSLKHGVELAMIDFVATTLVTGDSKAFQWWNKKKLIFQEYNTALSSGVERRLGETDRKVEDAKRETREKLEQEGIRTAARFESFGTRIDTFMTLTFTIVAVLFAGLGIVATKGSEEPSFVSSPVWVAAVALYFALRPYVVIASERRREENRIRTKPPITTVPEAAGNERWRSPLLPGILEMFIAAVIVLSSVGYHLWDAHVSARTMRKTKELASRAASAVDEETKLANQNRRQIDSRLDSLQQQINLLMQNRPQNKR